ncbi:MAG: GatB/YqeY domain-containing protein [Ignavibacteriae bacterium]|nr:GatB/YqeY domain-containing protein [Ignavibacteriota bacterium]MCB9216102.1 GatB/YqeY domain-containing protein [Ignavibacteria bacterium]
MKISERIVEDMKVAMKGGDAKRVAALRTLRAALLQLQKSGAEVSEEDELKAIQKQAKMSKDAVEQFSTAGREDLAEKERSELAVFEDYLPKQMTDQEIEEVVKRIAGEVGASGIDDFKNVMPKAMSELKGRADGGRVQAIVRQVLSGDIGA